MIHGMGLEAEPITAAESTRHSWDLEQTREARDHDLKVRAQELQILKTQTSWGILLKVPLTIIKLPLYIVLGIGFCVAMARGVEVGEDFWNLLQ